MSFDAAALRKAVGSAVRSLKQKGVKTLAWWLAGGDAASSIEAAVEGAILGNFEPDAQDPSSECEVARSVFLVVAPSITDRNPQRLSSAEESWPNAQNFTREPGQ